MVYQRRPSQHLVFSSSDQRSTIPSSSRQQHLWVSYIQSRRRAVAIANLNPPDQPPPRHHHQLPHPATRLHQHHLLQQPLAQQVPCRSVSPVPSSLVSRPSCSKRDRHVGSFTRFRQLLAGQVRHRHITLHCTYNSINWVANGVGFVQLQK